MDVFVSKSDIFAAKLLLSAVSLRLINGGNRKNLAWRSHFFSFFCVLRSFPVRLTSNGVGFCLSFQHPVHPYIFIRHAECVRLNLRKITLKRQDFTGSQSEGSLLGVFSCAKGAKGGAVKLNDLKTHRLRAGKRWVSGPCSVVGSGAGVLQFFTLRPRSMRGWLVAC